MKMPLVWHDLEGHSMWPLGAPLQAGVRQVPIGALQPGDMVAFVADFAPRVVLHRVIRLEATCLIARGDTTAREDPPVPLSAILGRVEAVRWGTLVLAIAGEGGLGTWTRRLGIAWSHRAPALRRLYAARKSARKGA